MSSAGQVQSASTLRQSAKRFIRTLESSDLQCAAGGAFDFDFRAKGTEAL
ncbi:Protein of unknown function, partial [Gryllus bimaculatus]